MNCYLMAKKRRLNQYSGPLSAAEIAYGINAAVRNAARLVADAELLFANERFPLSASVAVLAIEEAGKLAVLRALSLATDDQRQLAAWKKSGATKQKTSYG